MGFAVMKLKQLFMHLKNYQAKEQRKLLKNTHISRIFLRGYKTNGKKPMHIWWTVNLKAQWIIYILIANCIKMDSDTISWNTHTYCKYLPKYVIIKTKKYNVVTKIIDWWLCINMHRVIIQNMFSRMTHQNNNRPLIYDTKHMCANLDKVINILWHNHKNPPSDVAYGLRRSLGLRWGMVYRSTLLASTRYSQRGGQDRVVCQAIRHATTTHSCVRCT